MSIAKFYTTTQVAKLLEVRPATVREWIRDGKLKAGRLGKGWRISEDDLTEFLNESWRR